MSWFAGLTAEWVSALSAAVSALASIVLAALTIWLARLTRVLADETRATRRAAERADVQCVVQVHEVHVTIVEMVISNVGRGVAADVEVTIAPSFRANELMPPLVLQFTTMLPNETFRTFLGVFAAVREKTVSARGSYRDVYGKHEIDYSQDITRWEGSARISHRPDYQAADALSKIATVAERVSRGGDKLSVSVFDTRDRERERADMDRFMRDVERKEAEGDAPQP